MIEWCASIGPLLVWDVFSPHRQALPYQIQKFRDRALRRAGAVGGEPRYPDWFREDLQDLTELLRADKIHPVAAEVLPLSEARHAHELLESSASKGNLRLCHDW